MKKSIEELTLLIGKRGLNSEEMLELYLERSRVFRSKGKFAESIRDCTLAIEINLTYLEAYYERGFSKYLLGQLDNSLDDLQRVINDDPRHIKAYFTKSIIMVELNHTTEAIDGFSMVIGLDPEDAEAYYNRGLVYSRLESHTEAIGDFSQAIKINSNYFEAYDAKGYSWFKLKKYKKATVDFKKSIDIDNTYFEARVNYAQCLEVIGDRKGAVEQFKKAKSLDEVKFKNEKIEDLIYEVDSVGDFQSIFLELEEGFKKSENKWFWASIGTALITLLIFICILRHSDQSVNMYFIYIFLSVMTAVVIRQYTNAKNLRIEAVNRVAMAKLLQNTQHSQIEHYQKFVEPIIRSLVYSMLVSANQEAISLYSKLQDLVSK